MNNRFSRVALECFVDLGITVIYATIVGMLIVGIVASDDGPVSLLRSALYASLLPGAVIVLIAGDVMLRVVAERRELRRHGVPVRPRILHLSRP